MSEKLPALVFYPGDWLRDAVAGCSLAAQGLWLRMMILGHDSERYGYLTTNGLPTPPESIARRCGCTLDQFKTLLDELDAAGVPSRTPEGIIYSRRMARDANLRAVRAKAGSKGGKQKSSKRLAKRKQNTESENESEIEVDLDVQVTAIYQAYPKRIGRGQAEKAIRSALKICPYPELLAAVQEYAASPFVRTTPKQFIPHPATWFNGRRWQDDRALWRQADNPCARQDAAFGAVRRQGHVSTDAGYDAMFGTGGDS